MKKLIKIFAIVLSVFSGITVTAQTSATQIALLKYAGGGDWYANPTSLPNLIKYCNENLHTNINVEPATVDVGSPEIFNYPMVHMTGHGNVVFSNQDIKNLRDYLTGGGFLHVSDNYGIDQYIRREMKRVFPEAEFVELPLISPSTMKNMIFRMDCPRSMNTMANRHRDSEFFMKADSFVFTITSVTWVMDGRILLFITIRRPRAPKPWKWAPTSFNLYLHSRNAFCGV